MSKSEETQTYLSKQSSYRESIHRALSYLGLTLAEAELNELESKNCVHIGDRKLSDLGLLFIMASALFNKSLGDSKPSVTFYDLPKVSSSSQNPVGIPIYFWTYTEIKYGLFLAISEGGPVIFIQPH